MRAKKRKVCDQLSCVGVCTTCANQTMWLGFCASVWAGGSEGDCGKFEGAK